MQKELAQEEPSLDINIIGINEIRQEHANHRVTDGRDLAWLQDVDENENDVSDVWGDLWQIEYRDVVILDAEGDQFGVYNLTQNDLANAQNYATLKQMIVDAGAKDLTPWQNKSDAMDVSNDGFVSPIDALQVINFLISDGSKELPRTKTMTPFLDTSGDNFVSPRDALLVINRLNAESAEAENDHIVEAIADRPADNVTHGPASNAAMVDAAFAIQVDLEDDLTSVKKKTT